MQTKDPAAAGPELGPLSNPLEVFGSDARDVKTSTLNAGQRNALGPVVCDGSVYDHSKPHLLITLGNHTVEGLEDGEMGFDATCNRIISTVSTHDRCGVLVASERHAKALQHLGYPVVAWGQTVAFPMDSAVIAGMGTGEPHSGSLTVHSFFEPKSMHNNFNEATGEITGDGSFDGLNHLAGAYIPLALALKCSMAGDTHVNLQTTNSALKRGAHTMEIVAGSNINNLTCEDGTGGSILPDNKVICAANAREGLPDLVVTKTQVKPGFDALVQEMSGSKNSFSTKFLETISSSIGKGVFQQSDMDLELEIRRFASSKVSLAAPLDAEQDSPAAEPAEGLHINLCDLSPKLQLDYSSSSMVGMQQPLPIAAPTVIVGSQASTTGSTDAAADAVEAAKYGNHFATNSFTLESHYKLDVGRDIHPFAGILSLTHALFLGQISPAHVASICMPYARLDSNFRCCANANCNCATLAGAQQPAPAGAAAAAAVAVPRPELSVSSRFERMLSGVSHKIALTNNNAGLYNNSKTSGNRTGKDASAAGNGRRASAATASERASAPCTALTYAGTCKCSECYNATRLIGLAQLVTSCTHAFQKCDNYVSDQTVHAFNGAGVPQYTGTESMLPYGTALKSIMMRTGPGGPDDTQVRVGMNTDDCENCAFQGKAIMDTLLVGSGCVSRDYFHPPTVCATGAPAPGVSGRTGAPARAPRHGVSAQNTADDQETIRLMRLDSHSKVDQRHILLAAEVLAENINVNLGFFITGGASKSNDTNGQVPVGQQQQQQAARGALPTGGAASASASGAKSTPTCTTATPTPTASAITTSNTPAAVGGNGIVVKLPATVGNGMQALGSKPLGRRLAHRTTGADTGKDAAASAPVFSGHCTTTLGLMRKDGHMHTHISEGTGYVLMGAGDIPCTVYHRGEVSAEDEADKDVGYFNGPINTDHAVDVTVNGLMSSHVATINAGLCVTGANMRGAMYMGQSMHIKNNMSSFYNNVISLGAMQCVQAVGENSVKPGADVKTFVNQKVHPVIDIETAKLGHAHVRKALNGATCGFIRVADTASKDHRQFTNNCMDMSKALSPLRLGIQTQDKACLSNLGTLDSLVVNFPQDEKLKTKFGHAQTFFVTHVVHNEAPENYTKVLNAITAKARQKNSVFVNVSFAEPVVTASKEIIQFWRLYGAPKDPMAV